MNVSILPIATTGSTSSIGSSFNIAQAHSHPVTEESADAKLSAPITAAQKHALLDTSYSLVLGNPKGTDVLTTFVDLNCSHCKREIQSLLALIKANPQAKVIVKNFPFLTEGSTEAAKVVSAAGPALTSAQRAAFMTHLVNDKGRADQKKAMEALKQAGVSGLVRDMIEKKLASPIYTQVIEKSVQLAGDLGFEGTPSTVIGDQKFGGVLSVEQMQEAFQKARSTAK